MKLVLGSENFPSEVIRPAVALGNFDGVHIGHSRLITQAKTWARTHGGTSVVYTFNPHPARMLAPAECPPLLQTLKQKQAALEALDVGFCVIEPFTKTLAHQDATCFFEEILIGRLHAAAVAIGYDFTFGLHRQGTVEILTHLCHKHGIAPIVLNAQFSGEKLISSTNIRRLLEQGNVQEASTLLGRPYMIEGVVIKGRGIGKTFGVHTANIASENELIPHNGIYLTRTEIKGNDSLEQTNLPSITSIGTNPTFSHVPFSIETHLIDANKDILGKKIAIYFLDHIRDQIAFDSIDGLQQQIQKDIEEARKKHRQQNG